MRVMKAGKLKKNGQAHLLALLRRADEAERSFEKARAEARLAKLKYKETRKSFKKAKRAARQARKEARMARKKIKPLQSAKAGKASKRPAESRAAA
jgi:hypothetical protein